MGNESMLDAKMFLQIQIKNKSKETEDVSVGGKNLLVAITIALITTQSDNRKAILLGKELGFTVFH